MEAEGGGDLSYMKTARDWVWWMMLSRWVSNLRSRLPLTTQIFNYDGLALRVKGTITLDQDTTAQHVFISPAFKQIVVVAKVC